MPQRDPYPLGFSVDNAGRIVEPPRVPTERDKRVWTLSFYQAKGGVREITVVDGPCLAGNSTIEVVPERLLHEANEDGCGWKPRAEDAGREVERLRETLRQLAESDWVAPFVRLHARDALATKPYQEEDPNGL